MKMTPTVAQSGTALEGMKKDSRRTQSPLMGQKTKVSDSQDQFFVGKADGGQDERLLGNQ